MPKEIPLTQGRVAIVDDADYESVTRWQWYAAIHENDRIYAMLSQRKNRRGLSMHRFIMEAGENQIVHHKNGDGLDNRRVNLSLISSAHHMRVHCLHIIGGIACGLARQGPNATPKRYVGVSFIKSRNKWQARLEHEGKDHWLGRFQTPEQAVAVYNRASLRLRGFIPKQNLLRANPKKEER